MWEFHLIVTFGMLLIAILSMGSTVSSYRRQA